MAFNSLVFIFFILAFFSLWPVFKKHNSSKWVFLTMSSFVFYGWWDWRFIFLIVFSGLIDFVAARAMVHHPNHRKTWLVLSLIGNIGSLSFFKYTTFLIGMMNDLFGALHPQVVVPHPAFTIILPVGISFYTFQSMSYTIDVYRGRLQPTRNIWHFFSYLSMFPQLVAGPIIRARDLLHQLTEDRKTTKIQRYHALKLIAFGFFQKTVIADNLGYLVDVVFQGQSIYDGAVLHWIAIVAFAFQIYFDFSGYSLIAKGLAKMMGFHFKMNFNHPYLACSLREFWSRWHISLSTWFRDYVYIPLGGNKKGFVLGLIFMTITMLVSGLWHGASYTFLIWGGIHACFLVIERVLGKIGLHVSGIGGWMVTMIVVLTAWVFFRSSSLTESSTVFNQLFYGGIDFSFINFFFNQEFYLVIAVLIETTVFLQRRYLVVRQLLNVPVVEVFKIPVAFACALFLRGPGEAFIYFQF